MLLGSGGDVQMDLPDYALLSMPRGRPGAPERHRTPLIRATASRPRHTAALGDPGERTGAEALTRRAGSVERSRTRSPIWRGIAKTWKFQYNMKKMCINVL